MQRARAALEQSGYINLHFTEAVRAIRQPARHDENKPFSPGGGGGGRTAGSSRWRAQVKSVWRTFRFLLQQRRSVSISAGLNEGLVSRATGCRSTGLGVCVYYQSALVSTAGYIQRSPPSPPHPLSPPPSHKRSHLQERGPTPPVTLSSICP